MGRIKNINDLAERVARLEGKKKQVDIAQIKEVISKLALILYTDDEAQDLFDHYVNRKRH